MNTRWFAFIKQVYGAYARNGGAMTAASISYYALLSLIPLLLLAVSLFGFALRSHMAGYNATVQVVHELVPWDTRDIEKTFEDIDKARLTTGLLGIVFLCWSGSQFFHAVGDALNRTWGSAPNHPFWKGRLIALAVMAFNGILLLLSLALTYTVQWIQSHALPVVRHPLSLVTYFLPVVFSIVTFTFVYRFMPNTRVTWRESMVGGVFGGVLWELAKMGFGYYVQVFGSRGYNHFYGTLGGLILVVLWCNFTANIFVIGGEVARNWCIWNTPTKPRPLGRHRSSRPHRKQFEDTMTARARARAEEQRGTRRNEEATKITKKN